MLVPYHGPSLIPYIKFQKQLSDRRIERGMDEHWQKKQREVKLLLLGTGESGKSTVLKQMQIIYSSKDKPAFPENEALKYVARIRLNILEFVKVLCEAACKFDMDDLVEGENKEAFDTFLEDETIQTLPLGSENESSFETSRLVGLKDIVLQLWKDKGIQEVWKMRSDFQIIDAHSAYFESNNYDRYVSEGYVPTHDDILLCRTKTTGINTVQLDIPDTTNGLTNTFFIYDVGGQRNERRKWIHCFDDVTAVIFVAALSEYDQVLLEDSTQNRMVEAIEIFHQQLNSKWFASCPIILFLNKKDLFEDKIKLKDISDVDQWEDFSGDVWSTCDQVNFKMS